jgi:hypothetical protein
MTITYDHTCDDCVDVLIPGCGGEPILVAPHDEASADAAAELAAGGYESVTASDVRDALDLLHSGRFAVVLLATRALALA